ncbi:hypothetical protein EVAR_52727_1 [Eumeta japonica]|uniref:Uncharacterized protein n=1 Tax=Eumeta variegata TaxID=151549 RepID=A0A4C1ZC30_EUMVA|nr:hypothetical protein EVAR_52727_1 [Eumeta japonica]
MRAVKGTRAPRPHLRVRNSITRDDCQCEGPLAPRQHAPALTRMQIDGLKYAELMAGTRSNRGAGYRALEAILQTHLRKHLHVDHSHA